MTEQQRLEQTAQCCQQLHTVRDFIRWGLSEFARGGLFFGHGTDNAYDEALVLVFHALNLPLEMQNQVLDCRLVEDEKRQIMALFERRLEERLPAAYLTREAWFCGLSFYVDERVLVPRSPIAELIEQHFQPWLVGVEPGRILDLCTGSGCIGLACAYAFENAEVDLADISSDALDVATINIARHDLSHRVRACQSDVFDGLAEQSYDLIVSNPPYVDAEDLAEMPAEYHREPVLGLAAGGDGLDIARRILREAADYLNPGGLLVVEVGNSGVALDQAFPSVPFTWLEFERGGHGVFAMSREQLIQYRDAFVAEF